MFSCKKETEVITDANTHSVSDVNQPIGIMSSGDGKWDLLGFGYDITGEYAHSRSAAYPVIDIEQLKNANPTMVIPSGSETSDPMFEVGENAVDFQRKITMNSKFTGGDGLLFKGTINFNFSQEDKWSSKYIYAMFSQRILKRRVKVMKDMPILTAYLHPKFVTDANTLSPADLISRYGTHVLIDIDLGGRFEMIYRAETSSSNRIVAAGGGLETNFVNVFGVNINTTYDSNESKKNFNQLMYARTVGGAAEKSIGAITVGADGRPSATINVAGWATGVTDDNSELIGINDGIPIYEFVTNESKKAALRTYYVSYLAANQVSLMPDNVYEYFNPTYTDHYYTIIDEGSRGGDGSWNFEKISFKAFTTQATGSVPVYQYFNKRYTDHYYTTKYEGPVAGDGSLTYEKIAFYAFTSQQPGTVPVYSYFNGTRTDHYYTKTYEGATTGGGGWKYEKVAFYTFP